MDQPDLSPIFSVWTRLSLHKLRLSFLLVTLLLFLLLPTPLPHRTSLSYASTDPSFVPFLFFSLLFLFPGFTPLPYSLVGRPSS